MKSYTIRFELKIVKYFVTSYLFYYILFLKFKYEIIYVNYYTKKKDDVLCKFIMEKFNAAQITGKGFSFFIYILYYVVINQNKILIAIYSHAYN